MLEDKEKIEIKSEINDIVNATIKENHWERLSSKDYEEYITPTQVGKEITIEGKTLSGQKVNNILEEMEYIKRDGKKIILTEKGKKVGRYAICIKINSTKPLITDIASVKYKRLIEQDIKEYLEMKRFLCNNSKTIKIIYTEPIETPKPNEIKIIVKDEEEENKNGKK